MNAPMPRTYVDAAVSAILQEVASTKKGEGQRNGALNKGAFSLGQLVAAGAISHLQASTQLMAAAEQNGYAADHGLQQTGDVISAGLKAGMKEPREYKQKSSLKPVSGRHPTAVTAPPVSAGVVVRGPAALLTFPLPAPAKFPRRTAPDSAGKPFFMACGDEGPQKRPGELRRHIYCGDGLPVRMKIKKSDGAFASWYRVTDVDGTEGWQAGKPQGYAEVPYTNGMDPNDPGLKDDIIFWPEGERDVDSLAAEGLLALTFGGVGDGLPAAASQVIKDRHIVILPDNDEAGREHAEKKAALASTCAASVKVVPLPDVPPKGDVTDWFKSGGVADRLHALADAAPQWAAPCVPSPEPAVLDPAFSEVDKEIERLAGLSAITYSRERKAVAKQLGIQLKVLDDAVKAARPVEDTGGQGSPATMEEIESWPEPVDGDKLLDEMVVAIRQYLFAPAGAIETMALWVLFAHSYECFGHSPRLAITSPEKGCGKSTALDILHPLVPRPLLSSNASTAVIFRMMEMFRPTVMLDEGDTFLPDNDELRGILNAGHKRGGTVHRLVGDDHEPREFNVWTPCVIAMIGRLADTLADRALDVRLARAKPDERPMMFRSDRVDDLKALARQAARWAEDNVHRLRGHDPVTEPLFNRVADNWRPLFAIADIAGGEWPERVRVIAQLATANTAADAEQSARIMLLDDIRSIFGHHLDRITSKELVDMLVGLEGRPWGEWRRGKQISQNGLARLLAPFGIVSQQLRLGGNVNHRGYKLSQFDEAFLRYLSPTTENADQTATPLQGEEI